MDLGQRLQRGQEDFLCPFPRQRAGFVQQGFQRLSLGKIHDDVCGIIFPEQLPHPDNAADIIHLCHLSGFPQECVHAVLTQLNRPFVAAPNQKAAGCSGPDHASVGIELLDGNLPVQAEIQAHIRQAESALPQHTAHKIFSVQDRSLPQRVVRLGLPVIAAMRAGVTSRFLHAFHAAIDSHAAFSLFRLFSAVKKVGSPSDPKPWNPSDFYIAIICFLFYYIVKEKFVKTDLKFA